MLTATPSLPSSVVMCGTEIANVSFDAAVDTVEQLVRTRKPHLVVTANVDHVVRLRRDPAFLAAYEAATVRFADGAPLVIASSLYGTRLKARVTGADLLPAVSQRAAEKGYPIYIVGGAPGVAAGAAAVLERRYPGLLVAGVACPPFGDMPAAAAQEVAEEIRLSGARIVFACLGAPKQEMFLAQYLPLMGGVVGIGVGAAVDFVAGTQPRAPRLLQRLSLEWAYRLLREPRRLARRYLVDDARFLPIVVGDLIKQRRLK